MVLNPFLIIVFHLVWPVMKLTFFFGQVKRYRIKGHQGGVTLVLMKLTFFPEDIEINVAIKLFEII